jgi:hypothetical protein
LVKERRAAGPSTSKRDGRFVKFCCYEKPLHHVSLIRRAQKRCVHI